MLLLQQVKVPFFFPIDDGALLIVGAFLWLGSAKQFLNSSGFAVESFSMSVKHLLTAAAKVPFIDAMASSVSLVKSL